MAKILDYYDARNEEINNTIEADTTPDWSNTATYGVGDRVKHNNKIWECLEDGSINKEPGVDLTQWYYVEPVNELAIYDIYPTTIAKNVNSDIVLEYQPANTYDLIYVGNVYGETLKIEGGGQTKTFNLNDNTLNTYAVWNIENPYFGAKSLWLMLPAPAGGNIKVTVTRNANSGDCFIGYVTYGLLKDIGCTLIGKGIKFNVISGTKFAGTIGGLSKIRSNSWTEMQIPLKINKKDDRQEIIKTLAKYRGIPVLVIPDDTGEREELVFFGVYTDIESSITEIDTYNLLLSSLDLNALTPSTLKDLADSLYVSPTDRVKYNVTRLVMTGIIGGSANEIDLTGNDQYIQYTKGDMLFFTPKADNTGSVSMNVNALGKKDVYLNGNPLSAGAIRDGVPVLLQYDGNRYNVIKIYKTYGVVWNATAIGGSANAIEYSTNNDFDQLVGGEVISLIPNQTNTGATTINVNNFGDKAINWDGNALVGGELKAGSVYFLRYNGTDWDLQVNKEKKIVFTGDIGGSANALTLTTNDRYTKYENNDKIAIIPISNNTGSVTIDVNGLGAKDIYLDGNPLLKDELKAGKLYILNYNGSRWNISEGDTLTYDRMIMTGITAGSANAITLETTDKYKQYNNGDTFILIAGADNTGATTLNVNQLGAKNIKYLGNPLQGGEIIGGRPYVVRYNGTDFDLRIDRVRKVAYTGKVGGSANAITLQSDLTLLDLIEGDSFLFIPNSNNTGSVTLDVNSIGAKSIKDRDGNDLTADKLKAGNPVFVVYDGTNFVLESAGGDLEKVVFTGDIGGSANALTLTTNKEVKQLNQNDVFVIIPTADNTGAVTLDVNGIGAKNIKDKAGNDLVAGDLVAGNKYEVYFDGTSFILGKPPKLEKVVFTGVTGGTGNAITLTSNSSLTSLTDWDEYSFMTLAGNTGAVTLDVNGIGAKSIKMADGSDIPAGYLKQYAIYKVRYDDANGYFILDSKGCVCKYIGEYADGSKPTTRLNGNALEEEDLFYNTTYDLYMRWDGAKWVSVNPFREVTGIPTVGDFIEGVKGIMDRDTGCWYHLDGGSVKNEECMLQFKLRSNNLALFSGYLTAEYNYTICGEAAIKSGSTTVTATALQDFVYNEISVTSCGNFGGNGEATLNINGTDVATATVQNGTTTNSISVPVKVGDSIKFTVNMNNQNNVSGYVSE